MSHEWVYLPQARNEGSHTSPTAYQVHERQKIIEKEKQRENFHLLFHSQRAAMARAGPGRRSFFPVSPAQGPRTWAVPHGLPRCTSKERHQKGSN